MYIYTYIYVHARNRAYVTSRFCMILDYNLFLMASLFGWLSVRAFSVWSALAGAGWLLPAQTWPASRHRSFTENQEKPGKPRKKTKKQFKKHRKTMKILPWLRFC